MQEVVEISIPLNSVCVFFLSGSGPTFQVVRQLIYLITLVFRFYTMRVERDVCHHCVKKFQEVSILDTKGQLFLLTMVQYFWQSSDLCRQCSTAAFYLLLFPSELVKCLIFFFLVGFVVREGQFEGVFQQSCVRADYKISIPLNLLSTIIF